MSHPGHALDWATRLLFATRARLALAVAVGLLGACGPPVTRTAVVKPTTPADDAKPNSREVPDVYALAGRFERVIVLRLKYDTDLLAGIEAQVRELGLKNAVILSGIGSVRGYHVHTVNNRTFPSQNLFVQAPESPADITGMNGYVIAGRVHAHITLATPDHALGGHLEPETRVFTFAIVTLGVLDESVDLRRVDDKTYR